MIRLSCPGCQKKIAVGEHLAGRIVVCPQCKRKARIPRAMPSAAQPADGVEELAEVEEAEEVDDLEEIADVLPAGPPSDAIQAGPSRRRPPEDDYADEDDRPRRRRRRVPKPRRRKLKYEQGGGIFSEGIFGMDVFTVVIIGLALLSLPLLALSFVPGIGPIFALLAMALGSILSLAGGVWLIITAFAEDSTTGLLCLFIPFYMFYFILTEFETCKRPFMVYALGLVLVFGSSCAARPRLGYPGFGPGRYGAVSGRPPRVAVL